MICFSKRQVKVNNNFKSDLTIALTLSQLSLSVKVFVDLIQYEFMTIITVSTTLSLFVNNFLNSHNRSSSLDKDSSKLQSQFQEVETRK